MNMQKIQQKCHLDFRFQKALFVLLVDITLVSQFDQLHDSVCENISRIHRNFLQRF